MRQHCPVHVQVKAAGGIRSLEMALALHEAGANRLGCSRTTRILEELKNRNAT
jgi:deoxyribose-phosphate aldolase